MIMAWGGQIGPCDAKTSEKCLGSHHNNTALIKQISLTDTDTALAWTSVSILKNTNK